ncbi:hypothetical protein [Hwangdonia lutea]|uniref:Uncharacterized protein n=1 Tax=Hwangdonia lutea TaxID=3075823 RepID=A0AA97HR89_9FLAO|nr:hypothetical protein [Hwangdonia sp. SCSIO 19198]WOD43173.1 hypothetical protein RNZ46_14370 [Hwangdonia sp. SCSIO 19198]
MCVISDNIKFCTCVDDNVDIEDLNHYWVLHRYNKDKNEEAMGEPILPYHLHPRFDINETLLVNTLNTPEAFDKNLEIKRWDRLEVVLCNNSKDGYDTLYYNFRYTGKIWKAIESDCFDLMNRFDEVNTGEIKEI